MFKGSITALVTPFADGKVDEAALVGLIEWQIDEGTSAIVPCGTTGESPTLSHVEHKRVVEIAIEAANGRVPVIAGAGSNSTEEAISFVRHAQEAGADGLLIVAPCYNKPTQEGIYQHFKAIDAEATVPIIVYNVPGRSVVDIKSKRLPASSGIVRTSRASRTRQAISCARRWSEWPAATRSIFSPVKTVRCWVTWPMAATVASR
jgi:4-hydroxy-tetrahydrodipicolinate synthase